MLVMAPGDAMESARGLTPEAGPVEGYVDLGGQILEPVVEAAAKELGRAHEIGAPRLVEDTVGGCLLCTHAPSDTLLVSARILILDDDEGSWVSHLYLLLDSKWAGAFANTSEPVAA
jgi:hypothetical protein